MAAEAATAAAAAAAASAAARARTQPRRRRGCTTGSLSTRSTSHGSCAARAAASWPGTCYCATRACDASSRCARRGRVSSRRCSTREIGCSGVRCIDGRAARGPRHGPTAPRIARAFARWRAVLRSRASTTRHSRRWRARSLCPALASLAQPHRAAPRLATSPPPCPCPLALA